MTIDYDRLVARNAEQSRIYTAGPTKYALLEANDAIETLRAELALAETMEPYARQLEAELAATKARLGEAESIARDIVKAGGISDLRAFTRLSAFLAKEPSQ